MPRFSNVVRDFGARRANTVYRFSTVANILSEHSTFLLLKCLEQIEPDNPKEICYIHRHSCAPEARRHAHVGTSEMNSRMRSTGPQHSFTWHARRQARTQMQGQIRTDTKRPKTPFFRVERKGTRTSECASRTYPKSKHHILPMHAPLEQAHQVIIIDPHKQLDVRVAVRELHRQVDAVRYPLPLCAVGRRRRAMCVSV